MIRPFPFTNLQLLEDVVDLAVHFLLLNAVLQVGLVCLAIPALPGPCVLLLRLATAAAAAAAAAAALLEDSLLEG